MRDRLRDIFKTDEIWGGHQLSKDMNLNVV